MSPELKSVFENSDVVLWTETWTNSFSELHVENFEYYVLNRTENTKSSKRSSGGIVIYLRNTFVCDDTLVFKSIDDMICVKIPKNILSIDYDLYVCLCYVIPDDSSPQTMVDSNVFDRLATFITEIDSKYDSNCYFLLAGNFNARTSNLPDYVTDYTFSPCYDFLPDDYDVEISRFSQDRGRVNNNGNQLLDLCKLSGLRILNGRVGNDKHIGKGTFVGSNGSSLVNYVICSPDLISAINYFRVDDPNILSDHCIIHFGLDI